MAIKPDSGPALAPTRPWLTLKCRMWGACEECDSEFCECPHHGALIPRRELAGMVPAQREGTQRQ